MEHPMINPHPSKAENDAYPPLYTSRFSLGHPTIQEGYWTESRHTDELQMIGFSKIGGSSVDHL
jgi:hypothetical protein